MICMVIIKNGFLHQCAINNNDNNYYAVFNAPYVGHKDDESQVQRWIAGNHRFLTDDYQVLVSVAS